MTYLLIFASGVLLALAGGFSAASVFIWACFVLGAILHMLLKAQVSVRSPNGITSYGQYFSHYGLVLAIRFLVGVGLFALILEGTASDLIPFALQRPVVAAVAGLFVGLGLDSMIDKGVARFAPFLMKEVPPPPDGERADAASAP